MTGRCKLPARIFSLYIPQSENLELHGIGGEVFLDHQRNLKDDGVVEFPQIQSGEFFNFFKTVNQCISVNKQFSGCFGNVQVVFKEPVNGKQSLMIQRIDGTGFKDFFQKGFAPVSYTHLDVYKRQMMDTRPCFLAALSKVSCKSQILV